MTNQDEQLLQEARTFCDQKTGEVIKRMPEDLMKKLREGKLARGVPGKRSKRTDSYATWYVFLTDEIRDRVLAEWRAANRTRKRTKATAGDEPKKKPAAPPKRPSKPKQEPSSRGSAALQRLRKSSNK